MPGFPLAAIGAGLGLWAKNQQEQQAARERQQMLQLQIQNYQQEMQDRQKERQTQAAAWQLESAGGGGIGPVNPMAGGVGVPVSQAAPAALGADAAFNSPPPPRPSLQPGVGGAMRSAGDAWLNQNAPFPTRANPNPPPPRFTMNQPGPEAYAEAQGPGAPGSSPTHMPSNIPSPRSGREASAETQMADASDTTPPQSRAMPTGQQVAQMMAPDAHAKAQRDDLARRIAKIPNLSDDQRAELFVKQWGQIRPQEAEYAREYLANQRENRQDARADQRLQQSEANIDRRSAAQIAAEERKAKNKWGQPYKVTDPETGKEHWIQLNEAGDTRPIKAFGAGDVTKVGAKGTAPPLEEAQANFWAGVLKAGGSLPPGLRRSGVVEQIMKKMGSDTSMAPGDFIARHAGVQADTGSLRNMTRMADAAISFEKLAEKNFDVALKLAPEAIPTDLGPFFNRWIEEGEAMFGNTDVPPYVAAIITGANEYAKVMSGSTGTAASTVDSRKEARNLFSPYLSLPQISQVIAVAKADMKNRENTLTEQTNLIKQRLGSTAPVEIAPPATPKKTGQESQSAPSGKVIKLDADGNPVP